MELFSHLHPMVVHFPVALLALYSILEIANFFKTSDFLNKSVNIILILGVAGLVSGVLTGNLEKQSAESLMKNANKSIHTAIEDHEDMANITVWYFTALLFVRLYFSLKKKMTKKIKILFVIFSITGFVLIFATADYGGKLVYRYGVGTEIFSK